jgi:hypothetical protein
MTPDMMGSDVEGVLMRTFSYHVPAGSREVVDRRVEAAIASYVARGRREEHGTRFRTPARRVLIGLVAALLVAGGVAAGGTLFNSLTAGAPLLENVWARAKVIGQSATNAGYTVVLERAAVDPGRVWVAVSVTAKSGPGADLGRMHVTDANGVVMDGGTGVGSGVVHGVAASLFGFKVPVGVTPQGPFTFEVTSVMTASSQEVAGQWVFTFDVPVTPAFPGNY